MCCFPIPPQKRYKWLSKVIIYRLDLIKKELDEIIKTNHKNM